LALTKELVERHYGTINVRSEAGKGTKFIVRLPMGLEHFKPEEIVEEAAGEQSSVIGDQLAVIYDVGVEGRGAKSDKRRATSDARPATGQKAAKIAAQPEDQDIILIVDDHPDLRQFIRRHLEEEYQVIEAKDGQEGVELALEAIPDLVISDVMMPRLDGYQLCEALKTDEHTCHIPVILLTAKAGEESKLAGLETGADDYLVKPFNSRELQLRAHNLIDQRRKLRERFRREGLLQPREVVMPSIEEAFLQKLMAVLEENLAEEEFGVEQLSEALHIGRRQLLRKLRSLTGQPPVELIRSVRLQRARQLLEQKAGNVSEVAYMVGFNNLSYFAKAFREEFGILPSELGSKS
jgi:DNA-binding response OmpR family regulator